MKSTIRTLTSGLTVFLLIASLALASGDPWKAKPFAQWDEKDIRKILTDSPWSKIVQIPATWSNGGDSEGAPDPNLPNAAQDHSPDGGVMGQGMGPGAPPAAPKVPQATFVVRWISSRVVREAVLRSAVLSGRMKQEDAEKQAAQPLAVYQVLIVGQDMKAFQRADEKALVATTYLLTKKTKQRLPASGVEFERGPDGKTVVAVAFAFPQKSASGEATLTPDDKGVEFNCSVAGANFRASFDLPKMVDGKGQDL
ncbi:MAG: hypothetical protein ACRD5M_13880 [Candidatus Acidiferrales bacterium]